MKMVKLRYIIFSVAIISFSLLAQIPNPGFENWTGSTPTGWTPTYPTAILKSTDVHSGSAALRGEVASYMGVTIPPQIFCGGQGTGFPVSSRPKSFTLWYKFSPVSGDIFFINVILYKGTTPVGGAANYFDAAASYTKISQDFVYNTNDVPDNGVIQMGISFTQGGTVTHSGSYFIIDDLAFEGTATNVKADNNIPVNFNLKQNFPNPFNPGTDIEYSIPFKTNVKISVFNLIGQKVADILNEVKEAGNYKAHFNAGNLTSGIYFYKLEAGSFTATKKMILTK